MKKRLLALALTLCMVLALLPTGALAAQGNVTAVPSATKLMVNGNPVTADAYLINQNNYIKLRDMASMLNGTEKNFKVEWDGGKNAISLYAKTAYTPTAGDMTPGDGQSKTATLSASAIYVNQEQKTMIGYVIGGNNYFKLRDVMEIFDVYVGWDGATGTAALDTTRSYEKPAAPTPTAPGVDDTVGNSTLGSGERASDGDWIYYLNFESVSHITQYGRNASIFKVKKDGTGKQRLTTTLNAGIQVVGDWVYYVLQESNDNFFQDVRSTVYRMKKDGSGQTKIVTCQNDNRISSFLVADGYIYYSIETTPNLGTFKVKIGDKGGTLLIDDVASSMSIKDGRMYAQFTYGGMGRAWYAENMREGNKLSASYCSMKLDGSDMQRILTGSPGQNIFRVYNDRLYYRHEKENTLYSVKLDGSDKVAMATNTGSGFNLVGDWLYYHSYDNNMICRVRLDSSHREALVAIGRYELFKAGDVVSGMLYGESVTTLNEDMSKRYLSTVLCWNGTTWERKETPVSEAPISPAGALPYPAHNTGANIIPPPPKEAIKAVAAPVAGESYVMVTNPETLSGWDNEPGAPVEGMVIQEFRRTNQKFKIVKDKTEGWFNIALDSLNVSVAANLQEPGTRIILWSKTGSDSQRFQFEPGSEAGQFYVKSFGGLYFKLNADSAFELTSNKAEAVPVYFYPEVK